MVSGVFPRACECSRATASGSFGKTGGSCHVFLFFAFVREVGAGQKPNPVQRTFSGPLLVVGIGGLEGGSEGLPTLQRRSIVGGWGWWFGDYGLHIHPFTKSSVSALTNPS